MVAKDPELRTTEKGNTIARVLVAADELSKAGQKLDPAENKWHVALFFGDRAKEIAGELKKNMVVSLVGEHQLRTFKDKTTGEDREVSELVSPKVEIRSLEIKGMVAKDPELQFTASEKPFTRILIAADQVARGGAEARSRRRTSGTTPCAGATRRRRPSRRSRRGWTSRSPASSA